MKIIKKIIREFEDFDKQMNAIKGILEEEKDMKVYEPNKGKLAEKLQPGTKTWLMKLMKDNFVVVEGRNGEKLLSTPYAFIGNVYSWSGLQNYQEDLTNIHFSEFDICKIFTKTKGGGFELMFKDLKTIWQREEDIELQEIVKWLADSDEVVGGVEVINGELGIMKEFTVNCSNGYEIKCKNKNLKYCKIGDITTGYNFNSNKDLFEKVKELVNKDIDPIEIKEWLEEFTGLEVKQQLNDSYSFANNPTALVTYIPSVKRTILYSLKELGFYKGDLGEIYFETHKEALQWLKDNLVKPQPKEMTIEEVIEELGYDIKIVKN